VAIEKNAAREWYYGVKMDEARDVYLGCNRLHDNRVGVEFYRNALPTADPEVRLKTNQIESSAVNTVLTEQGIEKLALGAPSSTSDRGLNKLVVDNSNKYYVTQHDSSFNAATDFLHAEWNHWYDGSIEATEAAVRAQCEPVSSPAVDQIEADSLLTTTYTLTCLLALPSLSPPGGGALGTLAGRPEGLAPERPMAGGGTGIPLGELPAVSGLERAAPNPGRGRTVIRFAVARDEKGPVHLAIFDVRGRRVAALVEGPVEPGWHEVSWSGRDVAGKRVAAGVYFLRFQAGEVRETRKIVHLR